MRKLVKPNVDSVEVFEACISRVRNIDLKNRLEACKAEIRAATDEFESKVVAASLHTILPSDNVASSVTSDEMRKVYTDRMAKKLAPGRGYYDNIMSLPEHGRCPLCAQRIVSTLDHHLPKAHFPSLAVSPVNLIPACQDCNKTKSEGIPTCSESETLHPYYDDVEGFVWLKARIYETVPLTVEIYVDPSVNCPATLKSRLENHFQTFNLDALYSSHSAEELASIEFISKRIFNSGGELYLRDFLTETAESKKAVNLNSWQTALYTGLSESDWFCQIRFQHE